MAATVRVLPRNPRWVTGLAVVSNCGGPSSQPPRPFRLSPSCPADLCLSELDKSVDVVWERLLTVNRIVPLDGSFQRVGRDLIHDLWTKREDTQMTLGGREAEQGFRLYLTPLPYLVPCSGRGRCPTPAADAFDAAWCRRQTLEVVVTTPTQLTIECCRLQVSAPEACHCRHFWHSRAADRGRGDTRFSSPSGTTTAGHQRDPRDAERRRQTGSRAADRRRARRHAFSVSSEDDDSGHQRDPRDAERRRPNQDRAPLIGGCRRGDRFSVSGEDDDSGSQRDPRDAERRRQTQDRAPLIGG